MVILELVILTAIFLYSSYKIKRKCEKDYIIIRGIKRKYPDILSG